MALGLDDDALYTPTLLRPRKLFREDSLSSLNSAASSVNSLTAQFTPLGINEQNEGRESEQEQQRDGVTAPDLRVPRRQPQQRRGDLPFF
jgi:hypothetical protein